MPGFGPARCLRFQIVIREILMRNRSSVRRTRFLAPAAVVAASLASQTHAQDAAPVELSFAGEFAGQPFACADTFSGIGRSEADVTVADYRLFVSNVRLLDASGVETPLTLEDDGRWQSDGVALLDFEDGSASCSNGTPQTNAVIRGQAPTAIYTGVAFDIGIPFAQNHGDPTLAASPLNLTAMFWNWRGGYRFMRVDLESVTAAGPMTRDAGRASVDAPAGEGMGAGEAMEGEMKGGEMKHGEMKGGGMKHGGMKHGERAGHRAGGGWALHVGSSGCASTSPTTAPSECAAPNRIAITLPDFDPATGTIVIDPARVLAGVDVAENTPDTPPGCMSGADDPECGSVLELLGLTGSGGEQQLVTARP